MDAAVDHDSALDAILSEFTGRVRCGECPSVQDYVARYPAMADELRELLPIIETTETLKRKRQAHRSIAGADTPSARAGETAVAAQPASVQTPFTSWLDDLFRPAEQPDELGRIGSYRILQLLGRGGMGIVFRAEDSRLHRQVALKVMLPEIAVHAESRDRFLREAKMIASLEHDNVVSIFQVDEDRGVPYIAMPLLRGRSLEDALQAGTTFTPHEIARIGRETASGLAAAHNCGLVHRDIKPANIWLEIRGEIMNAAWSPARVKVLDFGLSRPMSGADGISHAGVIVGTPSYMSPEQARGAEVDGRADLFSLGVVLYRLATGRLPFVGHDALGSLMALASTDPPPPHVVNPTIPRALSKLIMRLLEKDPGCRIASAHEVSKEFAALERRLSTPPPRFGAKTIMAFLAAGLVSLGIVVTIATNNGAIEIRTDDDSIEILAERNGGQVTVLDPKSKQAWLLSTGDYTVRLKGQPDGLAIDLPDTFTLKRGETRVVTIRKLPPAAELDAKIAWKPLFNGKDLTGWKYHPQLPGDWNVMQNNLVGKGRPGWLFSERGDIGDFHLHAEFQASLGCDSGIFFWTPFELQRFPDGVLNPPHWHEANIFDDGKSSSTGSLNGQDLATNIQANSGSPNSWRTLEILAKGKRVISKVDGKTIADLTFPTVKRGHLALQAPLEPGATIAFRKIEIRTP